MQLLSEPYWPYISNSGYIYRNIDFHEIRLDLSTPQSDTGHDIVYKVSLVAHLK